MNEKDVTALLNKADELRDFLSVGQYFIPFLEDIVIFVREAKPILDELNGSIEEGLQKIPGVSEQLSKVTQATENATNEILSIAENFMTKIDYIQENLNKLKTAADDEIAVESLMSKFRAHPDLHDNIDEIETVLKEFFNEKVQEKNRINAISEETNNMLNEMMNDSSSIMMAMQVQDITSQQIAAVNHLLERISEKLKVILEHFNEAEYSELVETGEEVNTEEGLEPPKEGDRTDVTKMHRDIAFDPAAIDSMDETKARQPDVDDFIKEFQQNSEGG